MQVVVNSPNVEYTNKYIISKYDYQYVEAQKEESSIAVNTLTEKLMFRTQRKVPKLGVMLVGWGGNNGASFTAALIANKLKLSWTTRKGNQDANWFGSVTQASTVRIADEVHVPMSHLLPIVDPNNLIIDGWDISALDLAAALKRSEVFPPDLVEVLKPHMEKRKPRAAIFNQDYVAENQKSRADNVLNGSKLDQVKTIMDDIEEFRNQWKLDEVIVLWTATTERFTSIVEGINDTAENLSKAIKSNYKDISPSTLYAYAAISKGCTYINGSPQNTFVPGLIELAEEKKVFIAGQFYMLDTLVWFVRTNAGWFQGDDFKSGQTKLKSVLVDFLVSAGIKPVSIVSYNHLGNNDGRNLSAPEQFRSKEISKSNVVDDMVASNSILYKPGEKPDHVVVIKYVPYVGDSKRAMDEYISEIMMGGHNTLVIHNTCEDSLLAAPLILDLVLLAELFSRIEVKKLENEDAEYTKLHPVLSVLSYLCKAPLVPKGTPIVNSLFRQRACIENILRACTGLPPETNMTLEHKVPFLMSQTAYEEPQSKKVKLENGK
ncbi:hypothetical protein D910_03283 [Dendroctonus ponderosae]|uniref:inositol-3-phosphate synthase n=1 Tax=Dendroctonus ponderosae TaxID=77166 RepID=U4U0S3_DENPD|nr:hypothetical protein D910_03283 [Dendroctonus ponderosae]